MRLLDIVRAPVSAETRRLLDAAWAGLPAVLRTPRQFLGRQYAGCGATIGAMPRCDFACRGCYLADGANDVPAESLDGVRRQLDRLRDWLGVGGNVQLTDGEVTLRPEGELISLIRHARAIGLVPMVMTHGDSFRRRPGLLERLMVEGGLTELSLHIDTTQRGRLGTRYRAATRETELEPLRDEMADLVRRARRSTGRRLEVATTVTVTRGNLDGVPGIVGWAARNADAFKLLSFLPVSQVGRTEPGLGGAVSVDELWEAIAEGLGLGAAGLAAHQGWLGHPGCSRFVQGVVVRRGGGPPRFVPLFRPDEDGPILDAWLTRFGGLTFRLDTPAEALARLAGMVLAAPGLVLRRALPHLWGWPRRLDSAHPWGLVAGWLAGRASVHYLNIVSHHFMSAPELRTPAGQERLAACAFRVPVDGELVSMCAVNALGVRDRYYERLAARRTRSALPRA